MRIKITERFIEQMIKEKRWTEAEAEAVRKYEKQQERKEKLDEIEKNSE